MCRYTTRYRKFFYDRLVHITSYAWGVFKKSRGLLRIKFPFARICNYTFLQVARSVSCYIFLSSAK